MPHLSELLGTQVVTNQGPAGRVRDLIATDGAIPSVVSAVLDGERRVPWAALRRDGRRLRLEEHAEPDAGDASDRPELRLAALLDRQILDARGLKVVRVNDVILSEAGGALRVTGVDVGARGYLRRLGLERLALRVADVLGYALPAAVIPWSYVASLEGESGVRLGVDRDLLAKLRPAELADVLDALDAHDRARVLDVAEDASLAEALHSTSAHVQSETLGAIPAHRAAHVLEVMAPDEAADILGTIEPELARRLVAHLPDRDRDRISMLLGYHPRTAGGLMTPEFVSVPHVARASRAIELLREQAPEAESVYYVYAVDERGALRGVVGLRDLLTVPADLEVRDILRPDVVRVHVDDRDDVVADTMERYDLLAVPVVGDDDVLLGIITVDDVMRTVEQRASDDLAAVTGAGEQAGATLAPGRLGGLAWSVAAGLVAALVLLRAHGSAGPWFLAGAMPLLLRLSQDQGAWAMAVQLEAEGGLAPARALREVAAGALVTLAPAAALAVGAALNAGRTIGVALGLSAVLASTAAAALGLLLPEVLAATGRDAWMRRGRVVPLVASLGGLVVYVVLVGALS